MGRATRTRLKATGLWECPRCGSRYVQPVEWDVVPDGRVALSLRCPECMTFRAGIFSDEEVHELDRVLVRGRSEVRAIYRRVLRDNMYRELAALTRALELDLIGPDDFAPPRRYRCSAYQA